MGGDAVGDQNQLVKTQRVNGLGRSPKMSDVRRIEGSAVNADPFHNSPPC